MCKFGQYRYLIVISDEPSLAVLAILADGIPSQNRLVRAKIDSN